jgi:hypothetical protein
MAAHANPPTSAIPTLAVNHIRIIVVSSDEATSLARILRSDNDTAMKTAARLQLAAPGQMPELQ